MSSLHIFVEKNCFTIKLPRKGSQFFLPYFWHSQENVSKTEQKTFEKMTKFVDSLQDYQCSGVNCEESSDQEEAGIVIETDQSKPVSHTTTDQSKPVSHTATDQSKLVSCIDNSSEEEKEDLHLTLIFMNQLT